MLEDGSTEMAVENFCFWDSPSLTQSSILGFISFWEKKHSWLSRNTAEVSAKAYLTKLILQRNLAALNLIQIKIAAVEVWTRPYLPTTSFPPMLCRNAESIQSVLEKYQWCQFLYNLMWVDWMRKPMLGMIMYVNQCFVDVLTICYFFTDNKALLREYHKWNYYSKYFILFGW